MSANNPTLPRDQKDLLERIDRDWSKLMRAIESVTPEQMDAPLAGGWSVKDNLAHLSTWERFMVRSYLQGQPEDQAMEIDAKTLAGLDTDGINAIIQKRNHERPAAAVLADLRQSHGEVLQALSTIPFEALMQPRAPDDPEQRTLIAEVIDNTYGHYNEHRLNIERGV